MAKRREPKYVFPEAILEQAKLGYTVQTGTVEGAWPSDTRSRIEPLKASIKVHQATPTKGRRK